MCFTQYFVKCIQNYVISVWPSEAVFAFNWMLHIFNHTINRVLKIKWIDTITYQIVGRGVWSSLSAYFPLLKSFQPCTFMRSFHIWGEFSKISSSPYVKRGRELSSNFETISKYYYPIWRKKKKYILSSHNFLKPWKHN